MERFGQKIVERNFAKRFKTIIIAAVVLAIVSAISVALLFSTQIREVIDLGREHIRNEVLAEADENMTETTDDHYFSRGKAYENRWHRISFFRFADEITPVSTASIVIIAILGILSCALSLLFHISIIEWLYKMAVLKGLNRALWPILGLFFGLFAVIAVLIVLNDPKRASRCTVQTAS